MKKITTASNQATIRKMSDLLIRSGISLTETQLEQLWFYHTLLRQYNSKLNLTRIHNFENMVIKLYADSILPGMLIDLPSPLLDLGTGPGMPGIPLKIAFPHLEIILSESRQARVEFLNEVISRIRLKKISVAGRSISPRFQQPVAGVITRAVESMEKTLERIDGCLKTNGLAVFMKGPHCDDEIDPAVMRFSGRYKLIQDQSYQIPHSPHQRRLVVFQRTNKPLMEIKADAMERYSYHEIESEKNAIFIGMKKLLTARGIKKQQAALISGEKLVNEALKKFPEQCDAWISTGDKDMPPADFPSRKPWYRLSSPLFQILDVFGTASPLLKITTRPIQKWDTHEGLPPGLSILIPFQDPENVGAVIRSAVAFGAKKIILLEECANPYHPKAIRASGGAVLHAPLFQGPAITALSDDLPLVTLSPEGEDISQLEFPKAFGILPGLEGSGLPDHLRTKAFSIPICQEVESLNAATATAIVLFLWSRVKKEGGSV